MKKLRTIIIDDEPVARKILREFTAKIHFLELQGQFENAAKARAAGVGVMRRPVRTKRRCPSQASSKPICRLTAPWVSPSSVPASA